MGRGDEFFRTAQKKVLNGLKILSEISMLSPKE
jgi:hypothetical protein